MTDYSELVKALRICGKGDCVDCDRQRQDKCLKRHWNNENLIDGMLCEAAAAIEDMAKHITEMHERVTVLQIARGELEAEVKRLEPKRGEWIYSGEQDDGHNYYCHCSVCGAGDIHAIKGTVPYCWRCGAKMEVQDG